MTAKVNYADVSEGEELKPWTYNVQRMNLVMYAGASGDFNIIHWNEEIAKMVGLPNVISHGMFTMAKVGQYVTDWAGDAGAVVRFKTRFTKPVVVDNQAGNNVTVTGTVKQKLDGNRVLIELSATTQEGDNCAAAEAEVVLA
ncbi:MAG TPA: MaoC/PaaZ C-terminal domain-containing protein [Actinomycetota bacterium]|nr:MaoC/PaaZ C-terminal domain-containing protein [Actinomycetota bacterium]